MTLLSILAGKECGAEEGQEGGMKGQGERGGGQLIRGSMIRGGSK